MCSTAFKVCGPFGMVCSALAATPSGARTTACFGLSIVRPRVPDQARPRCVLPQTARPPQPSFMWRCVAALCPLPSHVAPLHHSSLGPGPTGDPEMAKYSLSWFARCVGTSGTYATCDVAAAPMPLRNFCSIVQHPESKLRVGIVFKGPQGVGKVGARHMPWHHAAAAAWCRIVFLAGPPPPPPPPPNWRSI